MPPPPPIPALRPIQRAVFKEESKVRLACFKGQTNNIWGPLDVPIHWSGSDQTDPPPEDWSQDKAESQAPGLPLDDGCTPLLDAADPWHETTSPFFL